ncbi:rCG49059 [Rattus norvegicus]|uniref:RCG49059 n=1 Tax=Rattus norvegicus TaxID=10116 RepID=A6IGY0_RAT|nr:rCG49059 [Rattus norvegicus]
MIKVGVASEWAQSHIQCFSYTNYPGHQGAGSGFACSD